MSDIVGTFRSYALDKDNCPRMGSEVIPVRVSLLLEAAAEITRLRDHELEHLGRITVLSEEITRLRAALREISDCKTFTDRKYMIDIARA